MPGTFIPVHHHPNKAETFVILKGKVRVSTYDDDGEVVESCVISQDSGTYGVDIPKNVWHGLECLEPSVLLECKEGPFVEHEVDGILEIAVRTLRAESCQSHSDTLQHENAK